LVAPLSGRMADKQGSRRVVAAGLSLLAFSYVVLWLGVDSAMPFWMHLVILVAGVVILDMGAQMTQVGNQTRIFGLVPSARSRLNTVYMTVYFSGAAAGSALSTIAWGRWKWNGVCGVALGLIALAAVSHALGSRATQANVSDSEAPEERRASDVALEV
jgi:MFS family permease